MVPIDEDENGGDEDTELDIRCEDELLLDDEGMIELDGNEDDEDELLLLDDEGG